MIIITRFLSKRYHAMAIWPFIFIRSRQSEKDKILINHEKIHLKQQIELLWIPFFIWYFIEFLVRLVIIRKWDKAYKNISFEKEAYLNETDFDYSKNKMWGSFIKYL